MINIRQVNRNDLSELSKVYTKTYEVFDVGERWTESTALELMTYWFERQPDLAFLADEDGRIIGGFFAGVKPWWDGVHLVDGEMFVHPDYQKKGTGSLLSKHLFGEAIDKYQAKVWDTYTFKKTVHPLSWYEKLGFTENMDWVMISGDLKEALKRLDDK